MIKNKDLKFFFKEKKKMDKYRNLNMTLEEEALYERMQSESPKDLTPEQEKLGDERYSEIMKEVYQELIEDGYVCQNGQCVLDKKTK